MKFSCRVTSITLNMYVGCWRFLVDYEQIDNSVWCNKKPRA